MLLGRFHQPLVAFIALVALLIATLNTNVAANVVSPSNDFSNLNPRLISFRTGGMITGVIGVLMMPWKLLGDYSSYIFGWLVGYSGLLGPDRRHHDRRLFHRAPARAERATIFTAAAASTNTQRRQSASARESGAGHRRGAAGTRGPAAALALRLRLVRRLRGLGRAYLTLTWQTASLATARIGGLATGGNDRRLKDSAGTSASAEPAHEALVEANRCLFCYDAPCTHACPTHIDIPRFIKKISTDNLIGSARTILEANLLGATCARVCPVQELCEGACVLGADHKPIMIGRLQRYAMDYVYGPRRRALSKLAPPTGQSVAVIGAGPRGSPAPANWPGAATP